MRHIMHTCLLAFRLFASVDNINAQSATNHFLEPMTIPAGSFARVTEAPSAVYGSR